LSDRKGAYNLQITEGLETGGQTPGKIWWMAGDSGKKRLKSKCEQNGDYDVCKDSRVTPD